MQLVMGLTLVSIGRWYWWYCYRNR